MGSLFFNLRTRQSGRREKDYQGGKRRLLTLGWGEKLAACESIARLPMWEAKEAREHAD